MVPLNYKNGSMNNSVDRFDLNLLELNKLEV